MWIRFNQCNQSLGIFMEYKILLTVFVTVFIAELGDKTQLATLLFAADKEVSKLTVFAGASLALIATSAIGVLAGGFISEHISTKYLHYLAGAGFIVIGIWTLLKA
jgi:putative Ca2+/H+ antiporter (TMEM165/GDT1 family)